MALKISTIGIIADDLTGANDTALQFLLRGCNTQILLDLNQLPEGCNNTIAWAVNTESRHLPAQDAVVQVEKATIALEEVLNVDFIYKKIDSTLRGNIAVEALKILESKSWDAAIIVPVFPDEGRITVGGYHLLRGVPIERTEVARDPNFPISQSHIPTLLQNQLAAADYDTKIVGHIQLSKVMRGAAPILLELQELIKKGKKLIVVDAVSTIDLEQIVLAMEKCMVHHKILPCGSAGLANAITKSWMDDAKYKYMTNTLPDCPVVTVVGSVTPVTRAQVKLLRDCSEKFNLEFVNLTPENLVEGLPPEMIHKALENLKAGKNLLIYSAPKDDSYQATLDYAKERGIEQPELSKKVLDSLATFTETIFQEIPSKLVLVGGETASYCCKAIQSTHLQLIDEVDTAIPLSMDQNARFIVTKSGNFGTPKTLVNIMNYMVNTEEETSSDEKYD